MRVMLDAGVIIHSEFAEPIEKEIPIHWKHRSVERVIGLRRKQGPENDDFRKQKEALFTVGRIIREGNLKAYTYDEIEFETLRGRPRIQEFNALQGCPLHRCESAVERSRFRRTSAFMDFFAKGGKKDRRSGVPLGKANQIAFLEWLCVLDERSVDTLVEHASLIGLSRFEIDSLHDLNWFQFVCNRCGSRENYQDVFHLWTAQRHGLDGLLTLDKGLQSLVERVKNEKKSSIEITVNVLRPLDLLEKLGINSADAIPINSSRFYPLY